MQLADFDFTLPKELIAQYPLASRRASKLMCLTHEPNVVTHRTFAAISELITPNDLLVFNNTRVIPARLIGHKATGGKVEVLVERILDEQNLLAQIRASKTPKVGDKLFFAEGVSLTIVDRGDQFFKLAVSDHQYTVLQIIELIGQIPLPPYMQREPTDEDKTRYQTIYALHKGSVAAPTAGFHFDAELLQNLQQKGVEFGYLTLHIGAGTFAPIRTTDLTQHKMHAESVQISAELCAQIAAAKARGKRVIAVGTTTLRALEAASVNHIVQPYFGDTDIFIYPGYQFQTVDTLITNLHLPRSTLLMLVCAFGGYDNLMAAYRQALLNQYRFYSYGDAMWIPSGAGN